MGVALHIEASSPRSAERGHPASSRPGGWSLGGGIVAVLGMIAAAIVERMDRGGGGVPQHRFVSAAGYAAIAVATAGGLRQDIDALTTIF